MEPYHEEYELTKKYVLCSRQVRADVRTIAGTIVYQVRERIVYP